MTKKIVLIVLNIVCVAAIAVFLILFLGQILPMRAYMNVPLNILSASATLFPYACFICYTVLLFSKHTFTKKLLYFLIPVIVVCTAIFIFMTYLGYQGISGTAEAIKDARAGTIYAEGCTKEQLTAYFIGHLRQNIFASFLFILFYGSFLTSSIMLIKSLSGSQQTELTTN